MRESLSADLQPLIADISSWREHWPVAILCAVLLLNLLTAASFWIDKRRARAGGWRIPESTILLLSFLGGWPGGLLASQVLRHKTRKVSFRVKFWAVVALQLGLVVGATRWARVHGWSFQRDAGDEIRISIRENGSTSPWPEHRH